MPVETAVIIRPLAHTDSISALTDLLHRAYAELAEQGLHFMQRLRELQARHTVIGEVRGRGLMIGMELVTDAATKTPAKELCEKVIGRAFQNGLLLLSCGVSTLRFMPPLLVSRQQVDEAVTLLEASLVEALASR